MSKGKIKLNSNEVGQIMDLVDVREELVSLKNKYEELSETEDKPTKYKASYTAVALAEACNLITHYLKNQEKEESNNV